MPDTNTQDSLNDPTHHHDDPSYQEAYDEMVAATKTIVAAFVAKTGQTVRALAPVLTQLDPPTHEVDVHLGPELSKAQTNQIVLIVTEWPNYV